MKYKICIFLLACIVTNVFANTICKDGEYIQIKNEDGNIIYSISENMLPWYSRSYKETDKYLYFSNKARNPVIVDKKTGQSRTLDIIYSDFYLMSSDSKFILTCTSKEKTTTYYHFVNQKFIKFDNKYFSDFNFYLYNVEEGQLVEIKKLNLSFLQKSDVSLSAEAAYDSEENCFFINFTGEGGIIHRAEINLDTNEFSVLRRTVFIPSFGGELMYCCDRLRLRENESNNSNIKFVMPKGIKVLTIKRGKFETIDNIDSYWTEIEIVEDIYTQEGRKVKKGERGWCYGGYLALSEEL